MALIGSSARITLGSLMIARAMTTRCAWPPDRSIGYRFRKSAGSRPAMVRAAATRSSISVLFRSRRCKFSGSATDLATCQRGSSEENGSWNTSPDSRRRAANPGDFRPPTMDWLSYSTLPESADSKPSIMRVSVDLPDPEPPITARHSPAWTSAETSKRTWWRAVRGPKDLVME